MLDPAGLWGALKRLRYARSSGRAEALFRIAFAAVLLIQLLWLRENVIFFYSSDSPRPPGPAAAAWYAPSVVWICYYVWLAAAALLLLGIFTRLAAVACFLGCMYFIVLRQPGAEHATDYLLPGVAFHVALLPSNRFFALERRWSPRPAQSGVPAWPLRLAQLSLAFFYFTAGTSKLGDSVWWHGKGFFMTFANPVLSRFDLTWLATSPVASPGINYSVMLWECSMPFLLLWRRTRLFAVLSAVVFLLVIDIDLPVAWFAWLCIANLFCFADDLAWPPALLKRWPWLAAPTVEPSSDAAPSWKQRTATAFLVFHLLSFAWLQLAYAFFAYGRYDIGMRMVTTQGVGAYGYGIANIRYYSLWPSALFYPIHAVYLEVLPRDGVPTALPPFDQQGHPHFGWLEAREVRQYFLAMSGLSDDGWRRYLEHVAQKYARESGKCPEEIQAFAVTVGPGSFETDLRSQRALLKSARFACEPATRQVRLLPGSNLKP